MIVYIQVQHFVLLRKFISCVTSILNQSYCIHLHPRDKDFARFIWFKDLDKLNFSNIETAEYQIYRLCRVLFGVSSSLFLLTGTLIHHITTFSSIDPDFVHSFKIIT